MRSTAFTRIFAVTLLAGFLPGVKADCWRDRFVYLSHIRGGIFAFNLIYSSFPLTAPP
jgi:hypothetical protein